MLGIERRRKIMDKLNEERKVYVSELAKLFGVTEETIRRDLEKLEGKDLLRRSYGGAVLNEHTNDDISFVKRSTILSENKQAIAERAARLVSDGDTIMVPLNDRARALVEKYRGVDPKGRLFPYISSQHYNDCIKEIFTICGLTRMVVKLDPVSGEEVTVPLNTVASSHMARRTFVGNLYKRVKDPNLICPMSGHKENSRAFTRYREVDREMRKEVVNLLD